MLRLRAALHARGHDVRLFTSSADEPNDGLAGDTACFGTHTSARTPLQAFNPWVNLYTGMRNA